MGVLIVYLTQENFFSSPWASFIDLFLPPCFSFSDKGEENVPDKLGKRMTFGKNQRATREMKEAQGRTRRNKEEQIDKERHLCLLSHRHALGRGGR